MVKDPDADPDPDGTTEASWDLYLGGKDGAGTLGLGGKNGSGSGSTSTTRVVKAGPGIGNGAAVGI